MAELKPILLNQNMVNPMLSVEESVKGGIIPPMAAEDLGLPPVGDNYQEVRQMPVSGMIAPQQPAAPAMPQAMDIGGMFRQQSTGGEALGLQLGLSPERAAGLGQFFEGIKQIERANMPMSHYLKLKEQEDDAEIKRQQALVQSYQLQSDLEYRRQTLALQAEQVALERQKLFGEVQRRESLAGAIQPPVPNEQGIIDPAAAQAYNMAMADPEKYGSTYVESLKSKEKPMPTSIAKQQDEYIGQIRSVNGINERLDKYIKDIENGKLDFGYISNIYNKVKNNLSLSNEESRAFSSFTSDLDKLRNDSLTLQKGTQTEGDATRAMDALIQNLNDTDAVKTRLIELRGYNSKAADDKKIQVDLLRQEYGKKPYDFNVISPERKTVKRYNPEKGVFE